MKKLTTILLMCIAITFCSGQDYYTITLEDDNTTYNYPESARFQLFDEDMTLIAFNDKDQWSVTGEYTLQIEVPWSQETEIIQSQGGKLQLNKLPESSYEFNTSNVWDKSSHLVNTATASGPVLIKKNVFLNKKTNTIEAYFFFSNDMVFCYVDGVARAYQNDKKLSIDGNFLIQGSDALLKLSYAPETGKMWYVFEKNKS